MFRRIFMLGAVALLYLGISAASGAETTAARQSRLDWQEQCRNRNTVLYEGIESLKQAGTPEADGRVRNLNKWLILSQRELYLAYVSDYYELADGAFVTTEPRTGRIVFTDAFEPVGDKRTLGPVKDDDTVREYVMAYEERYAREKDSLKLVLPNPGDPGAEGVRLINGQVIVRRKDEAAWVTTYRKPVVLGTDYRRRDVKYSLDPLLWDKRNEKAIVTPAIDAMFAEKLKSLVGPVRRGEKWGYSIDNAVVLDSFILGLTMVRTNLRSGAKAVTSVYYIRLDQLDFSKAKFEERGNAWVIGVPALGDNYCSLRIAADGRPFASSGAEFTCASQRECDEFLVGLRRAVEVWEGR